LVQELKYWVKPMKINDGDDEIMTTGHLKMGVGSAHKMLYIKYTLDQWFLAGVLLAFSKCTTRF
jgi:hypothetical protein